MRRQSRSACPASGSIGTGLPEVDRSVSTRVHEEAEEADDEVGGVAAVRERPKDPGSNDNLGHPAQAAWEGNPELRHINFKE